MRVCEWCTCIGYPQTLAVCSAGKRLCGGCVSVLDDVKSRRKGFRKVFMFFQIKFGKDEWLNKKHNKRTRT